MIAVFIAVSSISPINTNDAFANSEESGICDRTQQVRVAILAKLPGVSDCSDVSDSHLNGITGTLGLGNKGISSLRSNDFQGLYNLTQIGLANNDLRSLPSGIFDDLIGLRTLYLGKNELTSLPNGLFDDLFSLRVLYLGNNDLSALTAGSFHGLSNLDTLGLGNNELTSLPSGVFDDLSSLKTLYLGGNELSALPDGMFVGLKSLRNVWLKDNPGAPFTFTAELERRGDNIVAVRVAPGAPYDMRVTLSARGGVLAASEKAAATATVTVPGGSVFSEELVVTPDSGGDGVVTISVLSAAFPYDYTSGGTLTGLGESVTVTQTVTKQARKCFTQLHELKTASNWSGSWDDPKCSAYHRLDSPARYFRFTLSKTTDVSISLSGDGALFVSKGTIGKKSLGTPPNNTMEDRIRIRLNKGKLLHNGETSANLTLPPGKYFAEAVSTGGEETFTLSVKPAQ